MSTFDTKSLAIFRHSPIRLGNVKFGIFKSIPERGLPDGEGLEIIPDVVPLPDEPTQYGVGHTIPVGERWWRHLKQINNEKGYGYLRWTVDVFWINNKSWDPFGNEDAPAESINAGGNFFAYDGETETHYHMLTYSNVMDTSVLNPAYDNWYYQPWMYFKVQAIDIHGNKYNVANGVDSFGPNLRRTDRWVAKADCEPFPTLPFIGMYGSDLVKVVKYEPRGASVIGITDMGRRIWLCKSTKPGERKFPVLGWRLWSPGVIPPAIAPFGY